MLTATHSAPAPTSTVPSELGYALVDVETTGLDARGDRVVQVAISTTDHAGVVEQEWSTLVDPGRDPGPTHVHGITREMLAGAPAFAAVEHEVAQRLRGRVLVAHNARFDWGMLAAETARATGAVRVEHRLCTMTLARRLELGLPDLRLATLARHCGVTQVRGHDARDDVRVLGGVLRVLLQQAHGMGAALPFARCDGDVATARPDAAPRPACPWADPGRWTPGSPLVQGAKFAVTGPTRTPRAALYERGLAAGLVPMNSVSGRTRFVVCSDPASLSRKARAAGASAVPMIDEETFAALLDDVRPGTPATSVRPARGPAPAGPLAGRRVLVLGGPHARAVEVRHTVETRGGSVAVNLTASVTHVVELAGADLDRRLDATSTLERLHPETLDAAGTAAAPEATEPARLRRGEVVDLPENSGRWEAFVTWPADDTGRHADLDVVAFATDGAERVPTDGHFVFFNNLRTPGGAVELTVDTVGEARVAVDLDDIDTGVERVVVAAVSTDGRTFGEIGPVELLLTDATAAPFVRGVCDASTTERSMLVAEVYRRGERWRIRSVGQGYDDGLLELATRFGVDVE